jgi:hypothetical protein
MALMSTGYARVDKAPTFQTDPYPFVENLGQLADPEGRPLTEAYFIPFLVRRILKFVPLPPPKAK